MMLSSQGENTKAFVKPRIREITMELLKIIRETENDDLTTVMQKIVCSYTEELIPVAVQMCLELVQTFSQVLEGRYVYIVKVHIFWEGHKILRNLHFTFVCMYCRQT